MPRKVLWWTLRRNGLCLPSRACTPMSGVVCGSMVSTVRRFGLGADVHQNSVFSPTSWCWRRFRVSSAWVCHGSFSTLMSWCSSRTSGTSASPNSRCERLAWKVKGSASTWRNSWSLVLAMMSSRSLDIPLCCLLFWCLQQLRPVLTVHAVSPQELQWHH